MSSKAKSQDFTIRFLVLIIFILAIIGAAAVTLLLLDKKESLGKVNVISESGEIDRAEIEGIIQDFLEKNPELIVQSFIAAREKEQKLAEQRALNNISNKIDQINNDDSSPFVGNENGDIVVVKFSDYRCGYCKKAAINIEGLLKDDKNVKVVIKDFPILGPVSTDLSKLALAAYNIAPEKYFAFHNQILKRSPSSKNQAIELAKEVGIDSDVLAKEVKKSKYDKIIQSNLSLGKDVGISGTPAFIINGELVRGAVPLDAIKRKIATIRGRS